MYEWPTDPEFLEMLEGETYELLQVEEALDRGEKPCDSSHELLLDGKACPSCRAQV